LKITDRKKEMFKTSEENITAINWKRWNNPFIEQIMVGDGQKNASFIQPSFDFIKEWGYPWNWCWKK
jgi:long-subunit acyl-CoA synthetase (AMP-forming)